MGVTATTDRTDQEALGQVCQSVAYNYGITEAVRDGWLVPVEQQMVTIQGLDFSGIQTRQGDLHGALGLSEQSLHWLKAAWAGDRHALAIPMYDATCYNGHRPVGVRYRASDGRKFAATGSVNGIFIPYGALLHVSAIERIFVCEGPTDTAAALDLGCFALGRPACRGGEDFLLAALNDLVTGEVIVVTDNDGPGLQGARELLRRITQPKKLFVPPAKDLRSFRLNGGTREIINALLEDILRA